ncbi:MAG: ribonuclease R [Bacteroidia bacterium]|nr:ribonuclease R [Bacteroidia bacterium]MDW8235749.1 ribonuclease R [Bacteroidia bacterium]
MRPTTSAVFNIFLQKGSKKWRFSQLLEATRPFLDEAALQIELQALEGGGWIEQDAKGRYALRLLGHTFSAEVQNWREQAYVILSPFGLRVLLGDLHKLRLLPGDKVEVEITALYPEEVIGRLVRRLQPSRRTFVGIVEEGRNRRLYVRPQQPFIEMDFQLPRDTPSSLIGKKVAIRFSDWGLKYPIAEVIQILGVPREHQTEIHAILYEFDLPEGFPEEVIAEAKSLPDTIPPQEIESRHDFRGIPTFTIDPEDAKDFDDALSLRPLPNGLLEVGIHIADVSYYVKEESALDREAAQRGTSVYLVDRTIPMLPERLSAHLCSLKPQEDRLAFSVVFQMDKQARIHSTWMGRTVIRSEHRFTYEEAQSILDSGKGPFAEALQQLHHLARLLHETRMKEGGIRFDTEEIRFELDEELQPIRIRVKERKDSHRLIEEFMLLANRHVACFLSQQRIPTVYRVHDVPKPDKLKALKLFLEGWGYTIDMRHPRALTHSLNLLADAIQGKPESHIIQSVAIRSMPKALYTPHNIGHYGLGFTHYTHFTSPIRRYPDLLVHRILGAVLANQPSPYPDLGRLETLCRHSSEREKIAEQAERASIRYKQLEYLSRMTGRALEGIIVGIESWGLYVELTESRAEGLVSLRSLPTDIYERDEYGHELRARYTRRRYRLGDSVVVKVVGIDFDRRLVDLELLQHEGEKIR